MKIVNQLHGYVKVRITGYSPERFLNLCKYKEIKIWDLEATPDGYEMCISIQGFRQLKPLLKKTRTRIAVIKRYGVPFFMHKNRKHQCFWIGGIICMIMVIAFSRQLWDIKVIGNQTITDDVLLSYLRSEAVCQGMALRNVKCDEIADNIRKEFPNIIWVSASTSGCKLIIDVREKTDFLPASQIGEESGDIVATKDGTILQMITRAGIPCVKPGDSVKAGDVLVSGSIEVMNDAGEVIRTEQKCADADIYAEVMIPYEDICEENYLKKEYSKKVSTKISVSLGRYQFVFGFPKSSKYEYEIHTSRKDVRLNGLLDTSIRYGAVLEKAYRWREAERTADERETILEERLLQYCSELEQNKMVILEKNIQKTEVENGTKLHGVIKVRESIGTVRKSVDF